MYRVNGFLDLDFYFKELKKDKNYYYDDLFYNDYIIKSAYSSNQFWLKINEEYYYFKKTKNLYEELIVSECAKLLGIDAVNYDLAVFQGKEGVISKSYRKENADYISGVKILYDYFINEDNRKSLCEMGFDIKTVEYYYDAFDIAETIQTLEIVWQALEYRYKDSLVVKKLINGLIEYFVLNILIFQIDGDPVNWEIEEDLDGVRLAPYFDGGESFKKPNKERMALRMAVSFKDKYTDNYTILENFFKLSSQEFIDIFIEKFDKLNIYNFMTILKHIETKIERKIPQHIKQKVLNNFCENREEIEKIINKYRGRVI